MEAYGFYLILFLLFIVFVVGGVGSIIHFMASSTSGGETSEEPISRIRGDSWTNS
jgi:hypothetical protein